MSFIPNGGYKSTLNSTETPLGASATYTGTWETTGKSEALIQSYSDVAGTLYIDFSVDGTNADSVFPVNGWTCTAGSPCVHRVAVGAGRYFRVRYVNGSSAQTDFRLGLFLGENGPLTSPLNQSYNEDADSIIVRPSWTWMDASRGLINNVDTVKKFGQNTSVGTTYAPIALGGVYRTPQSSSATALRVKAGNANDTAAGSGAREVTLEGLDENFAKVTETLATAGASASSNTTATFTRLYRAYVSESGTYADTSNGSHAGDIVIEDSAGTQDWLTISATNFPKGQSEAGYYSTETGKTCFVKLINVSIDSSSTVELVFFSRANIDETAAPYSAVRARSVVSGVSGGSIETFGVTDIPYGPFEGPHDIGFMGRTSSGTATVSVEFDIYIVG